MNKTWTVLKTEFINTVTRRSFILTLILVPCLYVVVQSASVRLGSWLRSADRELPDGGSQSAAPPPPPFPAPQPPAGG